MSSQPTDELISLVDNLIDRNKTLLELCRNKQSAIFDREIEDIETLTEQQREASDRIEELNERRRELTREILPSAEQPVSLERVAESLEGNRGQNLDQKRITLKQIIRDIQRYSRENMRLLDNQMAIFNRLFEELEKEQTQETYDSDREKDESGTGEAMIFNEAV